MEAAMSDSRLLFLTFWAQVLFLGGWGEIALKGPFYIH